MTNIGLEQLQTPCVLVDHTRLIRNIKWAQDKANAHHVRLRPHIKTHKCLEIARLQLAEGAVGVTASKTDEALVFINSGIKSVTVAYPIISQAKLDSLLAASATHRTDLRLLLDSITGVEALALAAERHKTTISVFVKIDVGLHRCGLLEDDPNLTTIIHRIQSDTRLRFIGLLSHAGNSYSAKCAGDVLQIAREECRILGRVKSRIEGLGVEVTEVSVGATPTTIVSDVYEGITEIRPGNYVFMDMTPLRLGLIDVDRISLSVLATVISVNQNYMIIDAGTKVLSSDLGAHGTGAGVGYGMAYAVEDYETRRHPLSVVKLSEEHGFLQRNGVFLPIGSQVRVIPNHACPVANLTDTLVVLSDAGKFETWKVDARGCVL
jgi:D-serine deaminase-like pyridoxal phosphate-dependent protein